jgi:putative SOS response-associated peptidase YedK
LPRQAGRYFGLEYWLQEFSQPGGWFEWTVENGKKQPWYITRRTGEAVFMAVLSNNKPSGLHGTHQTVEVGFVILTEDCEGGMVDIHDRRPVVLGPEDALRWMELETPVEEATRIAQARSLPAEEFVWWKVDNGVNWAEPYNNGRHLLEPLPASA